jgi:nucleotide-binding universal stress UspA family protein
LNTRPADVLEGEKAVLTGRAKKVIPEQADRRQADLIVLDSDGYCAIDHFLFGWVLQAVVLHALCSVEVVRRPTRRARRR